ncbi:beta-N-acetylhexosaminidase [Dehalobacter sp. DCM]|uniref:beta-N-acetylhexosaminidase n=1 Tax=Dehalobacter sp. DCM TaxID=2907827 RepID=UPI003081CCE7|nr:beta-N-acetylhexosaminidase [Dehalobacter sp. DCM]
MVLLISMLIILAGCSAAKPGENQSEDKDNGPKPPVQSDTDPIQDQIKTMSLEEKVGQLVMAGIDGYENDDHSKSLIEKYHVGGFILLGQNIRDAGQMLNLVNSLKRTNGVNTIPLFLAIDEEGGRISRVPEEFAKIPSCQTIGQINNSQLSYQIGSIIGEELKSFGLNMNFGPVLDINSNPKNPVIGDRAFGSTADIVTKLGLQTMLGLQAQNIISVVKHFPGHGDTSVDSHVGLPMVENDLTRLNNFELLPFAAAIQNKVDVIMVAHILLPRIDPVNPASFSSAIISEVLRTQMNFDGVVITDDMTMGAIIKNYDIGEAAVKSINAGSDIVLVCHDFDKEEAVIQAMQHAVETGAISMDRLDQSVYRVLKLKQKYNLSDSTVPSVDPDSINEKINALYQSYPALEDKTKK